MVSFDPIANSTVTALLRNTLPQIDALILFGSTATGHARADSGVDLAVFGEASYSAAQLFDARMACEAVLRKQVDLIDLRKASTVLQMQVLKDGRYLLGENSPLAGAFELFSARSYEDWQITHRGLLQDIAERGTNYLSR